MIDKMFDLTSFKAQKVEYAEDQQFSSVLLQCRKLTLEKVSDATLAMFADLFLKKRQQLVLKSLSLTFRACQSNHEDF